MKSNPIDSNILETSLCFIRHPFLLLISVFFPAIMSASTVTFQNGVAGYGGESDTFLPSGNPDVNFANETYDAAGSTSGVIWRTLLRFNLSSIANQYTTINQIQLTLTLLNPLGSNTMNLSEVNTANSGWLSSSATWNNQNQSVSNGWDGGPGLGTTGYGGVLDNENWSQTSTSVTFTITGAVATGVINDFTTGSNPGFIITSTDENGEGVFTKIASVRASGSSMRPLLSITYTPTPEPSSAILLIGAGAFFGQRRVRRLPRRLAVEGLRNRVAGHGRA
jgi:hypothetical protein